MEIHLRLAIGVVRGSCLHRHRIAYFSTQERLHYTCEYRKKRPPTRHSAAGFSAYVAHTFLDRWSNIVLTSVYRQPPSREVGRQGLATQPPALPLETTRPLIDDLPGPNEELSSETRLLYVHSHFPEEGANNTIPAVPSQSHDQGYSERRNTPSTGAPLLAAPTVTPTAWSNAHRPQAMDVSEHLDPGEPDAAAQRSIISPTDLSIVFTQRPTAAARHEAAKDDPGE